MASTTSDRSTGSTATERHTGSAATDRSGDAPGGLPRIDQSVFAAVATAPALVPASQFVRWFACFATAGRSE